jgi:hypothetical protein
MMNFLQGHKWRNNVLNLRNNVGFTITMVLMLNNTTRRRIQSSIDSIMSVIDESSHLEHSKDLVKSNDVEQVDPGEEDGGLLPTENRLARHLSLWVVHLVLLQFGRPQVLVYSLELERAWLLEGKDAAYFK